MDELISFIFFETVLGSFIIPIVFLIILVYLQKYIPKRIQQSLINFGCSLWFILIFTLPVYPRYQFHKVMLEELKNIPPYARIIDKSYFTDILEPITFFKDFIGSVYIVSPSIDTGFSGEFKSFLYRFKESPVQTLITTDCRNKTKTESHPKDGVWVYKKTDEQMNDLDVEVFCKTDWSKEREIIHTELIKNRDKQKIQNQ